MKYTLKTYKRSILFLLIGISLFFSAACGGAPQTLPEPNTDPSSLSASAGALLAKPELQQPVGISQPAAEPALQKAALAVGQEPAAEIALQQAIPADQTGGGVAVAQPAAPVAQAAAPAPAIPVENLPPSAPKVGFLAPDFTLQTMDGQSVSLADLRGRPVLINYWTSWCIPCKEELPALERIYRDYQDRGLVILSINAIDQDTFADAQQSIQQYGMSYPVLLDQGEIVWKAYEVMFFPTSFLVDSNGIIREIILGSATEESFRGKIDQLIAGNY